MPLKRLFRQITTSAAIATLLLPGDCSALILAGVKSLGLADAVSVHPVDAFVSVYNPASATLIGDRFDIGGEWLHRYQRVQFRNVNNGDSAGSMKTGDEERCFPEFAINKTFRRCLGKMPIDISLSFAYYTKDFWASKYESALASDTLNFNDGNKISTLFGTTKTAFEYQHQVVAPAIAVRICDKHAIGVSLNYNIQRINVKGFQVRTTPITISTIDASHFSNMGDDYSHGIGATIGYTWQMLSCVRLGIAYEPKTSMDAFNKYRGFLADEGSFDLPQRIRSGFAFQYSYKLAFTFDFEYIDWRSVPFLRNKTNFNKHFGDKDGPGLRWNGQAIFRVGMDWQILRCLGLRFGYEHANRPMRDKNSLLNTLDFNILEDTITFGATYKINKHNEISFLYGMGLEYTIFGQDTFTVRTGLLTFASEAADLRKTQHLAGISWGYLY